MKICARCGNEKSETEFYVSKKSKNGYTSYCKSCCCQIQKHHRNPTEIEIPPRQVKTHKQCSLCKEIKPFSEFSPRKRKDTKDGIASRCKLCNKKLSRKSYSSNPEIYRQYTREYRKRTGYKPLYKPSPRRVAAHNHRARKLGVVGILHPQEWEDLKKKYSYTCLACKKQEPEINLVFDHIIPLSKGGTNTIDNVQPLCFSCNAKKHTKIIDYR